MTIYDPVEGPRDPEGAAAWQHPGAGEIAYGPDKNVSGIVVGPWLITEGDAVERLRELAALRARNEGLERALEEAHRRLCGCQYMAAFATKEVAAQTRALREALEHVVWFAFDCSWKRADATLRWCMVCDSNKATTLEAIEHDPDCPVPDVRAALTGAPREPHG